MTVVTIRTDAQVMHKYFQSNFVSLIKQSIFLVLDLSFRLARTLGTIGPDTLKSMPVLLTEIHTPFCYLLFIVKCIVLCNATREVENLVSCLLHNCML